jgi:tRNA pseudouridine55 synthase
MTMDIPNILPVWQPVGFSTHIISAKVAEKYKTITSHTGTLDPMAEGVIIVLLDEERYKKYEYSDWTKEYEFEIVFGLSTDTYDGLGIVTSFHNVDISKEDVAEVLKPFVGSYVQDVPPFSSARVEGKPLHWFARNKKLSGIEIPRKAGEIYEIELLDMYTKDFRDVVENINERISLITGDFRQDQIKTRWYQLQESLEESKTMKIAKIRVVISRGMYIRSLSQDIAHKLNTTGFVYSLVRTRNGQFTRETSKTLSSVFGKDYLQKYNFVSRKK